MPDKGHPSLIEHECKVLVVEDSLAERIRLVAMLQNLGYQVLEAGHGEEALASIRANPVDIVISDWRMPKMSGFDLCRHLKQNSESAPYFIMLTSQKTIQDLVAGLDAGADDFIAKPFAVEELRVRLQAGRRMVELRRSLSERNQEIAQTLERESAVLKQLRGDLSAAETLQRALLPDTKAMPHGTDVLHYFRGAHGVAGDGYNIINLSPSTVAFYLLDVSGHGVRAAMISFYATQLLTNVSRLCPESGRAPDPSQVAANLNDRFLKEFDGSDYLTMVYGIVNLDTGVGSFCQAGHPNPFILDPGSDAPQLLGKNGFPIGLLEHAKFESIAFEIRPGQRLVLTSDGLFSCRMKSGVEMRQRHVAGLLNLIASAPPAQQQSKLAFSLDSFLASRTVEDDVSVLVIQRNEVEPDRVIGNVFAEELSR